jgi:hypothetical protein
VIDHAWFSLRGPEQRTTTATADGNGSFLDGQDQQD